MFPDLDPEASERVVGHGCLPVAATLRRLGVLLWLGRWTAFEPFEHVEDRVGDVAKVEGTTIEEQAEQVIDKPIAWSAGVGGERGRRRPLCTMERVVPPTATQTAPGGPGSSRPVTSSLTVTSSLRTPAASGTALTRLWAIPACSASWTVPLTER